MKLIGDTRSQRYKIVLGNFFGFVVAYYMSFILHEYAHGVMAWLFDVKSNPTAIYYGGLFLLHINEAVNYKQLIAAGRDLSAAYIAISGLVMTLSLFVFSIEAMKHQRVQQNYILLSFCFWLAIINMMGVSSYIPFSTFDYTGDVGQFVKSLRISIWWAFVPGVAFVLWGMYRLYAIEIIKAYVFLPILKMPVRCFYLVLSTWVLLLYPPTKALLTHGVFTVLGDTSVQLRLGFWVLGLILCWPTRHWVQQAMLQVKDFSDT